MFRMEDSDQVCRPTQIRVSLVDHLEERLVYLSLVEEGCDYTPALLLPDAARKLAIALIEYAAQAEKVSGEEREA